MVPGFDYSPAMKRSKIVWDEKTLDRFLAAPLKVVPGTTMTYDGIAIGRSVPTSSPASSTPARHPSAPASSRRTRAVGRYRPMADDRDDAFTATRA
jgi:hypothetical protein